MALTDFDRHLIIFLSLTTGLVAVAGMLVRPMGKSILELTARIDGL